MQKIINITLKATAAILAMYMAAACVFEKEIPMTRGNERQHVAVQLGIGAEGMTQTKADDNSGTAITTPDAENPVQPLETTIKTLRIYAYTKEGANFVLCGYYQAFAKEDGTLNTTGHVMDLNLPSSGTVKVYFRAVANESAMLPGEGKTGSVADNYAINAARDPQTGGLVFPDAIGFDELNNILYTVDQKFKNGMPMYADQEVSINVDNVGSMNTADGHNGHFILQEKVNLTLTRSLAKIEVYAAEAAAETTGKEATTTTSVTITGVSLANVPASGNLFTAPAADASITYATFKDAEGKETAYSTSFLKAGTVSVSKKVKQDALDAIKDPANYTLVSKAYYLAENNQGDEAKYYYGATDYTTQATVLKIEYSLDGGKTSKPGYVKMPQIKRNTWYKVLARIQANGEIELVFVVKPWNVDKTVLTYSDVISITTPAAWTFQDSNNASFDDQKGEVSLRTSTDSYFTFKIDQPAGATWTATLIPISGQLDSFKFIENGSEVSTVTGDVGTSNTLTIRPTGSPDAENNVASLRITIKTKEGNTKFVTPSELLKNSDVSYKEFTIIHSN